jgi:hypothetical protein
MGESGTLAGARDVIVLRRLARLFAEQNVPG